MSDKVIAAFNEMFPEIPVMYSPRVGGGKSEKTEPAMSGVRFESSRDRNVILYGPPGTGKTYHVVNVCLDLLNAEHNPDDRASVTDTYQTLLNAGRIRFLTFHQSFSYEDFVEGIRPTLTTDADSTEHRPSGEPDELRYSIVDGIFKAICHSAALVPDKAFVLVIDEINRGNISGIFGELITLIEDDKRLGRTEALTAVLPYSRKTFGVPDNLFIVGTMNTADRSLTGLDLALRRRFAFIEYPPNPSALTDADGPWEVHGIRIADMLERLNLRLAALRGSEYAIGHAFFMSLADPDRRTFADLSDIFRRRVIPLLREYFFDDPEGIRLALGQADVSSAAANFVRRVASPAPLVGESWSFADSALNEAGFYAQVAGTTQDA